MGDMSLFRIFPVHGQALNRTIFTFQAGWSKHSFSGNDRESLVKIIEGREILGAVAATKDRFSVLDVEMTTDVATAIVCWLFHNASYFLPHVSPLRIATGVPACQP
jgi:hypothetical protein